MDVRERSAVLGPVGLTGRDAEWLALVCLHSGVFLRGQYLAFVGSSNRSLGYRLVQRLGTSVIEERWPGRGNGEPRMCRIIGRRLYRTFGVENVRHRRRASLNVMLRRLLSLDYVLEHEAEWLVTEAEKVAALEAAGVPRQAMPFREYGGSAGGRSVRRHFVHKLPICVNGTGVTFVFTQVADAPVASLRTWGEQHAEVWASLHRRGHAVRVVVVGRDPVELAAGDRVLAGWAPEAPAVAKLADARRAVAEGDDDALSRWGGVNGALAVIAELEQRFAAPAGGPGISVGETWRSRRVPE